MVSGIELREPGCQEKASGHLTLELQVVLSRLVAMLISRAVQDFVFFTPLLVYCFLLGCFCLRNCWVFINFWDLILGFEFSFPALRRQWVFDRGCIHLNLGSRAFLWYWLFKTTSIRCLFISIPNLFFFTLLFSVLGIKPSLLYTLGKQSPAELRCWDQT